jgi:hypothetical protein
MNFKNNCKVRKNAFNKKISNAPNKTFSGQFNKNSVILFDKTISKFVLKEIKQEPLSPTKTLDGNIVINFIYFNKII